MGKRFGEAERGGTATVTRQFSTEQGTCQYFFVIVLVSKLVPDSKLSVESCEWWLPLQEADKFADGGREIGFGGLAVGEGGAEAGVEFVSESGADDFGEVGSVNAAAGENDDAISGSDDQLSERGSA